MYSSDEMFLFSFLGAYLGVVCLIGVVLAVLSIVANWKIYTKAGRPGWKCLIPICNIYVLFDMVWETKQFWIYVAILLAYYIFMGLAAGVSGIFGVIALLFGIAMLVWSVRLMNHLSVCFGHGPWFTVGLVLLNTIFVMILGLGDSKYCHLETVFVEMKADSEPEGKAEEGTSENETEAESEETVDSEEDLDAEKNE